MAEPWLLGIEIGGTKLQLGIGRGRGEVVALERLAVDPSRQAGEDQITFVVRSKQSRAVAAIQRQLNVDIFERLLIRENCKVVLFVLILVLEL